MGYVHVKGIVRNITDASKQAEVEFIVDTGAIWTVVPGEVLESLNIKPVRKGRFKLADGQGRDFPVGHVFIEVEGVTTATTVVFGSEGAPALLGVTTLEQLGLEVDPISGKLKPMELMLL